MTRDTVRQFGPLARDYALSESHARGRTLAMLALRVQPRATDAVLDVATGGGHTALAFAPAVRLVVAHDVSRSMVQQTLGRARDAGLSNLRGVVSPAECIPFAAECFDVVTCRTAAHHFDDLGAALREARRVLRSGGRLAWTDLAAATDPELRALQHRLEVLHDATHRGTWTPAEWRDALEGAGFREIAIEGGVDERLTELPGGTSAAEWCERSRTPPEAQAEILRLLREARQTTREALGVRDEGDDVRFCLYKLVATARA
ncbi:MAG: methyltransferase domain-containing protein [Deltaproteobacteria bacterium]|nr:methyltransferase domain-containing protein [Deltaproteobacteria bacterium]